jgi:hypothetical protein
MMSTPRTALAAALLAALASGCAGDLARQGRSPVQLVIESLTAASGATPEEFGGTLLSDVVTLVERDEQFVPTIFNDVGEVSISLILKDPGGISAAAPTALNQVTIDRYRVVYRRADGRNTPGVDVPYSFDSAVNFTVPADGAATAGFQIVRHSAKQEAPLLRLASNPDVISTLTEITFFGHDQAGNAISVTGTIGIDFGNFADPE